MYSTMYMLYFIFIPITIPSISCMVWHRVAGCCVNRRRRACVMWEVHSKHCILEHREYRESRPSQDQQRCGLQNSVNYLNNSERTEPAAVRPSQENIWECSRFIHWYKVPLSCSHTSSCKVAIFMLQKMSQLYFVHGYFDIFPLTSPSPPVPCSPPL